MKKLKDNILVEIGLTTVFMGLLSYAAYSLWYIFYGSESSFDVHLYTVLSGMALGWFFVMLTKAISKNAGWVKKLIAFLGGNALFQALIWGIHAAINEENYRNEDVVIYTFTVAFALSAIVLTIAFILKAKKGKAALCIIFTIIYFIVSCGGIFLLNIENIKALSYKKNIQFDSIAAEEMAITSEETALCTDWVENTFYGMEDNYPFTFKVDGEAFNPSDWEQALTESPEFGTVYANGQTDYLVLKNKSNGLEVTVETTVFESNATCQWIVYIKNTDNKNSGVISDFYPLNTSFKTGKADLYYSMGSNTAASDFSLIKKELNSIKRSFSGIEGKPTESFLPYFNIHGENVGMMLGIGWTGQWAAELLQKNGSSEISVKQENLNAYLLPDESIRSPLVSVSFYKNDNALKGFNIFRKWIMDCVYPENVTKSSYTVMEVAGPESTRTSDEIIEILDGFDDSVYKQTDAFWMDAGWYTYNEGWYDGVGNWTVDTKRYDKGISELSGYAAKKGLGHTLWYEPERIFPNTNFHKIGAEKEEWLISLNGEDNIMWNLANQDAYEYYCDYILNSLKENGVTIYRQDFNFAPYGYWQKADKEYYDGRTGICENHYVTNLYNFLDYLTENVDGLIIDNCASGGKRLDLEMAYRSIAFWRSDYNCSYHPDLFDATQSHTYGISFWLPITGSALYMEDEYAGRSDIMPLMLMDFFSHTHPEFSFYKEQRELMGQRYYPLDFGSFDNNKMLSMQFSTEDALSGTVLIYKRENVTDTKYNVKLNGLIPEKTYNVTDIDNPDKVTSLTGEQLMQEGITLPLPEGRKAIILMFEAK